MRSTPVAKAIAKLWKHAIQTTLALYGCHCIVKEHPSEDIDMLVGSDRKLSREVEVMFRDLSPVELWGRGVACDDCIATSSARGSAKTSTRDGGVMFRNSSPVEL